MTSSFLTMKHPQLPATPYSAEAQYVTVRVAEMWLGLPLAEVHDVIRYVPVTPVPLAPAAIHGIVNLRGRIMTVLNMRRRLKLPDHENTADSYMVVVRHHEEYVALLVDSAEEVLTLPVREKERLPSNIDDHWRKLACGVFTREQGLLIILDIAHVIEQH